MEVTEICVQVFNSFNHVIETLIKNKFTYLEKFYLRDSYFTHFNFHTARTISYETLLRNSVLLRRVIDNVGEKHQLIYKNKTLNKNGDVIKEEKVRTRIEDVKKAHEILNISNFNNWCDISTENLVFVKDGVSILVQKVENLGIFLEMEEYAGQKGSAQEKFEQLVRIVKQFGFNLGNDYSCKKIYMLYNKTKK